MASCKKDYNKLEKEAALGINPALIILEEYKKECSRLALIFPEMDRPRVAAYAPLPFSHYLRSYKKAGRAKASDRWRGAVKTFADKIAATRHEGDLMPIIEKAGYGQYFTDEAEKARDELRIAQGCARQVKRYLSWRLKPRKETIDCADKLEEAEELAARFDPPGGG